MRLSPRDLQQGKKQVELGCIDQVQGPGERGGGGGVEGCFGRVRPYM